MCFASFLELLELDKVAVALAGFQKVFVLAEGKELAVLQKGDLIHVFHGGDSMRDENGRFALSRFFQTGEDIFLRFGIDGGNRVVQNENGRVFHECAGDGYPLLLTARNGHASFAEDRAVALVEADDVIVNVRKLCGVFHGFVMVCTVILNGRKGDVIFDGIAEKEVILRNVCCVFADGADRNGIDILAVDEYGAVGYVICTENEIDERGLAAARFADDTDIIAFLDIERDIGECIVIAARITEREIFE